MDEEGNVGHKHLLMIRMHNDFVRDTFQKVKSGVEFLQANEKATREKIKMLPFDFHMPKFCGATHIAIF